MACLDEVSGLTWSEIVISKVCLLVSSSHLVDDNFRHKNIFSRFCLPQLRAVHLQAVWLVEEQDNNIKNYQNICFHLFEEKSGVGPGGTKQTGLSPLPGRLMGVLKFGGSQ